MKKFCNQNQKIMKQEFMAVMTANNSSPFYNHAVCQTMEIAEDEIWTVIIFEPNYESVKGF